jgi:hypothetical protein
LEIDVQSGFGPYQQHFVVVVGILGKTVWIARGGKDKAMVKAVLMGAVAPGHAMGQGVATLLEQLDRHYLAPDGSLATKSAYLDLVQVLTSFHPSCQFLCFCFLEESDRGAEYFFPFDPVLSCFLVLVLLVGIEGFVGVFVFWCEGTGGDG